MSPPPPAEGFASRLLLGPALRTQSDRRLVSLVRNGYETAFEEIVRRYGRALGRYAGAIVPKHRAEDVTQDAFSKALLSLRQSDAEIELRPWLYRIVRNTALNDLRNEPPAGKPLEALAEGGPSAYQEVARHQELADLMERLRALPEPQRAAIVMRELEGLSHEEIAATLGLTGGAARQVIYRARRALRDGLGVLIPLPLIELLLGGAAAGSAGAAGAALGGSAGAGGGAGAGLAIKSTAATLLVAGGVGTGVALREADPSPAERRATVARENAGERASSLPGGSATSTVEDSGGSEIESGEDGDRDSSGPGSGEPEDRSDSSGSGPGADDRDRDREDSRGPGSGHEPDTSGPGSGEPDSSGPESGSDSIESGDPEDSSGPGSDSDSFELGDPEDSSGHRSDGSGSGGSGSDFLDSSGTGSGSDAETESVDD